MFEDKRGLGGYFINGSYWLVQSRFLFVPPGLGPAAPAEALPWLGHHKTHRQEGSRVRLVWVSKQWTGSREHLRQNMVFTPKTYMGFL